MPCNVDPNVHKTGTNHVFLNSRKQVSRKINVQMPTMHARVMMACYFCSGQMDGFVANMNECLTAEDKWLGIISK